MKVHVAASKGIKSQSNVVLTRYGIPFIEQIIFVAVVARKIVDLTRNREGGAESAYRLGLPSAVVEW